MMCTTQGASELIGRISPALLGRFTPVIFGGLMKEEENDDAAAVADEAIAISVEVRRE